MKKMLIIPAILLSCSTHAANIIRDDSSRSLCKRYSAQLDAVEVKINNRSLEQDRETLWNERNRLKKLVRKYCD